LKTKGFFHFGYESQIRLSLVVFIVFLILLNFGTEYLFQRTKQVLKDRTDQLLSTVSLASGIAWERNSHSVLTKNLLELSFKSGIHRITFISPDGTPLISSSGIPSSDELHTFQGLKPESVRQIQNSNIGQETGTIFTDFYSDHQGKVYLACYTPMEISVESKTSGTNNMIWIMVEKDITNFASLEKMSQINMWIRIGGLVVIVFVTLIFIKNLLKPYRQMVKKAESENIIWEDAGVKEGELDSAVSIFEQVIRELKQKEKTLQALYRQTDRKAKDLASYNEYILKNMISGMVICNERGEVVQINQPAEAILGIYKRFVIGKSYKTAFREKDPICTAIGTTLGEQKAYSVPEVEITTGNGESLWISINSTVIKDERDRMLGVVVFLNDFTEIKKLEQEIAFKDKMASLGEMSSGLAHELRNSMGAIIGFAKLLLKRKNDPESQSQAVDSIVKEAMNMETMLKSFLAFAKPLSLKIEAVALKDIVEECYVSVKETLKESRIAFKVDSDPELSPLWGDRILLKQCLQNLIQNSIDAMPQGGELNIRLGEKQQSAKERSLMMEISDTGYGIPKEIQDKVFNPFFTSKENGTGLGLSIVKKIISLHHGRIELESKPNQGTTFSIFLPIKPPLQSPSEKMAEEVDTKPQLQAY
jgi:PAS domain S-box-containing protein